MKGFFEKFSGVGRGRVSELHEDQSGAIALLALAGLLIILMTVMMMYDAGQAAREKVQVQTGTDTAAYSQAVVKARSMNMIAYSNITKRMFYGYTTIYTSAFIALVEVTFWYAGMAVLNAAEAVKAIKGCAAIVTCIAAIIKAGYEAYQALSNAIEALKGILQLILESLELMTQNGTRIFNGDGGGFFPPIAGKDNARSFKEVVAVDEYQNYISKIAPWWAWGEAASRGPRNGATLIGTYPIPKGKLTDLQDKINFGMSLISKILPGNYSLNELYGTTSDIDSLPVTKTPSIVKSPPVFSKFFKKFFNAPNMLQHFRMCGKTLISPEFWAIQYFWEHWKPSEGYWNDTSGPSGSIMGKGKIAPKWLITGLEILQLPIGCAVSALVFNDRILPYEWSSYAASGIPNDQPDPPSTAWLKKTSNIAIGFKHGKGRLDDEGRRQKLNFLSEDYEKKNPLFYENEGLWALSKSEYFYDPGFLTKAVSSSLNVFDSIPVIKTIAGKIQSFLESPGMWAPRWSARMRPMHLEGEELADLDKIYHDVVPFMAISSPVAYVYENSGSWPPSISPGGALSYFESMYKDVFFMERAADGFTKDKLSGGFEK